MKERLFYDTESEKIYTVEDIEEFHKISIADGNTFAVDSIEEYINACLFENNGTLIEIKKEMTIRNGNHITIIWNVKTDL